MGFTPLLFLQVVLALQFELGYQTSLRNTEEEPVYNGP